MDSNKRFRSLFNYIVIFFILMVTASSLVLSYGITKQCEQYMLSDAAALLSVDATQMQLNIDTYFARIENNVALMFSNQELFSYDASTTKLEEYDRIQIEDAISNRIVDLGSLENYSDFCVLYANNNTVGWKSKTTQNMYADADMYEDLASKITNEKTLDGWAFGVRDNYERMYYVKRYNPNALILTSFYSSELEKAFEYPEELQGMKVQLVDEKGYIVYSSDVEDIGLQIAEEEQEYIKQKLEISAITDDSLLKTNLCKNGWMVVCRVSKEVIMKDFYDMRRRVYLIVGLVIALSLLVSMHALIRISKPMDGMVGTLSKKASFDELSGVLNRFGFKERVNDWLGNHTNQNAAFIMFDMDNFKKINDTKGHDYGDAVIQRMGGLLNRVAEKEQEITLCTARLGGDEFAIFAQSEEAIQSRITTLLDTIFADYGKEFAAEKQEVNLSLSCGAAFLCDTMASYDDLYKAADLALYESKNNGKNRYTIYQGGQQNEN